MTQNRQRLGRAAWAILALSGTVCASTACGAPPPRAPNPTRPIDERRAVQVIAQAFNDERTQAVAGRRVEIRDGKVLEVDVGALGRKYGVAYVTAGERQSLGASLPRPEPGMEDALHLVRGTGEDRDAKILVLHDTNYMYDDQVGTEHEATIVTAERKLARDVRDFVVRARSENWP
jgi:hypothetical protein